MPRFATVNNVSSFTRRAGGIGDLLSQATLQLGGIAPYHYWDFTTDRALFASADVGDVDNTPGWSFARASTGYAETVAGTLTSFASGALRRTDKGVLIEGARTNLCTYSQQFDDATGWPTKTNITVTANAATAPDGTSTADTITDDAANAQHRIACASISFTSGTAYCASVFAKAGTDSRVQITFATGTHTSGVYANFNLSNGTVSASAGTGVTSGVQALANGWYRCWVAAAADATSTTNFLIQRIDSGTALRAPAYIGSSTTIQLWGAQLEAASFPSSYIPTTTASATRAADVLSVPVNTSAQIAAAVVGQTELVTNGGFAADTNWTKAAGVTISGGVANYSAVTDSSSLYQNVGATQGKYYAVTYTVTRSAGTIQPQINGTAAGTGTAASGTFTELIYTSGATNGNFIFVASSFTGTIDNVSVKEVPAGALTLYPLSLFAEFERVVDTGGAENIFCSGVARQELYVTAGDAFGSYLEGSPNTGVSDVAGAIALATTTKGAARFAANDMRACRGGTLGGADTTVSIPADPATLYFGARASMIAPSFGYLRRAAIVSSAATDAQLQAMTSS